MGESVGEQLWLSRKNGTLYEGMGHPVDVASAYAVQEAANVASGQQINGYKIGATIEPVLEMLGLQEPFFGPLFSSLTRESGENVPVHSVHQPKIEAEFVICIKSDLGGIGSEGAIRHVTEVDVLEALDWVAPGFEFIGTRFSDTPSGRGFCTIADFGSNLDMVIGKREKNWQSLDLNKLPVTLLINGSEVASGHSGMSQAGNPLKLVAWMLNHPQFTAAGLKAGQIVSCGTCTGAIAVKPGDLIEADYGSLGTLKSPIMAAS